MGNRSVASQILSKCDAIAVSLLSKIGALRSFSTDKLHYWRESASGMSTSAYFRNESFKNYSVLLALVYCVTGIAYAFAIYFEPGHAQSWSDLLPMVLTLVGNQDGDTFISRIGEFCYTKWNLEAFTISNAEKYDGVWLLTRCGLMKQKNYSLSNRDNCLFYFVVTGIISRGFAFFCLVTFHKK